MDPDEKTARFLRTVASFLEHLDGVIVGVSLIDTDGAHLSTIASSDGFSKAIEVDSDLRKLVFKALTGELRKVQEGALQAAESEARPTRKSN